MASFEAQRLGGVRRSYRYTSSCRGSVCGSGFNRNQRRCDPRLTLRDCVVPDPPQRRLRL